MDSVERRIVTFTAGSHALVHTYELSIPILLTVWIAEFSTTAAVLGIIVTVGYGLFGVGALPGGILVDRFGSKPLILACLAGMAGSFILVSLAPNLLTLAIAIAVWGVTASVYHPAGLSLISKSIDKRGTALGYHGIGGNLGIALGPLATALLLLVFDWRVVAAALTIPAVVVVTYGVTVDVDTALSDSDRSAAGDGTDGSAAGDGTDGSAAGDGTDGSAAGDGTDGSAAGDGTDGSAAADDDTRRDISLSSIAGDTRLLIASGFLLVFTFVAFSGLYYRTFLTFLPDLLGNVFDGLIDIQLIDPDSPYADEFDISQYLYVAVLMVGVFGQYLGGRIADSIPPERGLILFMSVLMVLALLFVPASATTATFVAVSLLLGVALFTIQPITQSMVAAYSPREARGISFGYVYLGIFGVGSLGAALAGIILTRAGPRELFFLLAGIAALGAITAVAITRFAVRQN